VVTAPEQLREAVEALEQGDYDEVCIKPCVSVYGKGFGRITAQQARCGAERDHVEHWLAKNVRNGGCEPQLVMQFLPGHEYSVDIAAREGELLAAAVRRKPLSGAGQLLQHNPLLVETARALVAHFKLNAMVNVQFREDAAGRPRLLEINPRASGGIGMSCLSGINLPDIALRAALQPGYTVPPLEPIYGVRVAEISRAVIVPDAEREPLPAGATGEPRAA
jgi:predicted ATP-grasp superfamily ATP-dependent carboligase